MTTGPPALAVRVSLRHPGGEIVERERLCWSVQPSAQDVLRVVAGRALTARRRGLRLAVDDAPAELSTLMAALGLPFS